MRETLGQDGDPLAAAVAKDQNFLYWMRLLKFGSLEPDEAVALAEDMWRVAADQHGATQASKEGAFIMAAEAVEEENRAHAYEA